MTTNDSTSAAAHAAPVTEASLKTLDPSAGYVTTTNTYTVAPERAEEVCALASAGVSAIQPFCQREPRSAWVQK